MQGRVSMDTVAVHGFGTHSQEAAPVANDAAAKLSDGWLPRSEPQFKSMLLLCRQKWIFTLYDLRDALQTTGEKFHDSARAVESADTGSADQF